MKIDKMQMYERSSSVSLYSVMQSNVPEPFQAGSGTPTHLNMPGGGQTQQHKYISGKMQGVHPSRQYSTTPGLKDVHSVTPQGVQGFECTQFRLWLQNCQTYNLDCEQQLADLKSGRKTLAEIFEMQEEEIKSVVNKLGEETGAGDDISIQGVQGNGESYMTKHIAAMNAGDGFNFQNRRSFSTSQNLQDEKERD